MPKPHLGEFSFVDSSWLPMPTGGLAVAGPTDQTYMPTSACCKDAQALQCMTALTEGNGPLSSLAKQFATLTLLGQLRFKEAHSTEFRQAPQC